MSNYNSQYTGSEIDKYLSKIKEGNYYNPNLLINSDFKIWQRGISFSQYASPWVYTADHWRVGGVNDGVARDITLSEDGSLYVGNDTNAGIGYVNISQVIEGHKLENVKKMTATVRLKGEVATGSTMPAIALKLLVNNNEIIQHLNITTTYETYNVVFDIGEEITAINNLEFRIYVRTPLVKLNVAYAKLEVGGSPTIYIPSDYQEEFHKCSRYYLKLTDIELTSTVDDTGEFALFTIFLPCSMRITPSITSTTSPMSYIKGNGQTYSAAGSTRTIDSMVGNILTLKIKPLVTMEAKTIIGAKLTLILDADIY